MDEIRTHQDEVDNMVRAFYILGAAGHYITDYKNVAPFFVLAYEEIGDVPLDYPLR